MKRCLVFDNITIHPSTHPSFPLFFSFHSDGLPVELSYALDESEEGSIAVNVLTLLLASRNSATNKEKSDK